MINPEITTEIDISGEIKVPKLTCLFLDIYGLIDCFPTVESVGYLKTDFVYVNLTATETFAIPEILFKVFKEKDNFIFAVYRNSDDELVKSLPFGIQPVS